MTLAFILSRSKLYIASEKLMENISDDEKRAMWIRIHHETPFFVKSEFLKTRAFIGSEISPETAAKVQRRLDGLLNFVHTELDGNKQVSIDNRFIVNWLVETRALLIDH